MRTISTLLGVLLTTTLSAQTANVDYDTFFQQSQGERIRTFNAITPDNRAALLNLSRDHRRCEYLSVGAAIILIADDKVGETLDRGNTQERRAVTQSHAREGAVLRNPNRRVTPTTRVLHVDSAPRREHDRSKRRAAQSRGLSEGEDAIERVGRAGPWIYLKGGHHDRRGRAGGIGGLSRAGALGAARPGAAQPVTMTHAMKMMNCPGFDTLSSNGAIGCGPPPS
jgi:hypothetical protein